MKKKLTMILLALVLCTTSLFTVNMKASAEETGEEINFNKIKLDLNCYAITRLLQCRFLYQRKPEERKQDCRGKTGGFREPCR